MATLARPMTMPAGGHLIPRAWQGLPGEVVDWMKSTKGPKDGIFKVSYHAVDWFKIYNHGHIAPELMQFRHAMKDCKNAMAIAQFPEQISKVVKRTGAFFAAPGFGTLYDTVLDSIGIISPINDTAEFLNSRVLPVSADILKPLSTLNAAVLAVTMTDLAVRDIILIANATTAAFDDEVDPEPAEIEARNIAVTGIALALIDLAKCVSYIALAAIALISTLYVPIAFASYWILVASTSALGFTILGEFANRAYIPYTNATTAQIATTAQWLRHDGVIP